MKMHWISVCILCASLLIDAVYGGKNSNAGQSCTVKCDVVQELTLLRQLLNQESLLRINTNNEIMELKKAMKDIVADFNQVRHQVNTSIGETATKIEETAMKVENLEKSTTAQHTETSTAVQRAENTVQGLDSRLTKVKASVNRARRSMTTLQNDNRVVKQDLTSLTNSVTTVKNDNRAAKKDLTSLQRTMTSMKQTSQGKFSLPYNIFEK